MIAGSDLSIFSGLQSGVRTRTYARAHTHTRSIIFVQVTQVCVCVQQCFKSLTRVCIRRLCMCAFSFCVRAQAHYVGDKCTLSPTATFQSAMFLAFIVGESLRNLMGVCICICFIMKACIRQIFRRTPASNVWMQDFFKRLAWTSIVQKTNKKKAEMSV